MAIDETLRELGLTIEPTEFSNGVRILNCTPHVVRFLDNEDIVEVPPCGITLPARADEQVDYRTKTVELVRTVFIPDTEQLRIVQELLQYYYEVLLVGSIISAQAYAGDVVGMIPVQGYERVSSDKKLMRIDKFNVY